MTKAEYEARAACSGLGWSEADIKSFVDWHVNAEERRARKEALTDAILDVAVNPLREKYAHKDFDKDNTPAVSRGYDPEYEQDAKSYQRNQGKT